MTPTTFRHLREHLGLSVAYAADVLGVSTRTVSRWEHGDTALPTYAQSWMSAWIQDTEKLVSSSVPAAQIGGRLCQHASEPQYRAAHGGRQEDLVLDHTWWNRAAARVAASTGAASL